MSRNTWQRKRRIGRVSVLALALGVAGVAPVQAQTRFAWDSVVDVGRYTTFEECQAATYRTTRTEELRQRFTFGWADTMEVNEWGFPPLPPRSATALASARRCMARFTPNDSALDAFPLNQVVWAFLAADRVPDAEVAVARRLATAKNDTAVVTAIEDSALTTYDADHYSWPAWERLLAARAKREGWNRRRQLEQLRWPAIQAGDTAQANAIHRQLTAGNWLDSIKVVLDPRVAMLATGDSAMRRYAAQVMLTQILDVYADSLLDTLKLGTVRWKAAQRALLTRVAGPELAALVNVEGITGKPAPPVSADSWFDYDSSAGSRPTRGKVGIVAFVNGLGSPQERESVDGQSVGGRCIEFADLTTPRQLESLVTDRCWRFLAPLRRLMKRFPTLEVTLVSATSGDGLYRGLADSADVEAELLRRLFLEGHQLKGAALGVFYTHYFRLPDDRMILLRRKNPTAVQYEKQLGSADEGAMYLVDRQGLVVERIDPGSIGARTVEKLVAAVLQQPEHP